MKKYFSISLLSALVLFGLFISNNIKADAPYVTTLPATGITQTDANLNGITGETSMNDRSLYVSTDFDLLNSLSNGVGNPGLPLGVYSTDNPGYINANTEFSYPMLSATDINTDSIIVNPNTTYYFMAWAKKDGLWYHGEILNFTTLPEAPERPSCPFDAQEGRTIVEFPNHWIVDTDTDPLYNNTSTIPTNILAGTYKVSLASWDGYLDRISKSQPNEQWTAVLMNDATQIAESSASTDLEDNVIESFINEVVDNNLVVSGVVNAVFGKHVPPTDTANSVYPVCVAFDKQEEVPMCKDELEGSWADSIVDFSQAKRKNGSDVLPARSNSSEVLGESDWTSGGTTGFISLGFGGSITVAFDSFVPDVEDSDISIHEVTNGTYPLEKANIEVSQNGTDWELAGTADNTPVSKITYIDFSGTSFNWIKYVRVTDTSDSSLFPNDGDGFDLDAIDVTQQVCDQPKEETQQCNIISDTTNIVEDGNTPAVETYVHPNWVSSIPDSLAKWIWSTPTVTTPATEETEVFIKTFTVGGPVSEAEIKIAADNGYKLEINDSLVVDKLNIENNFSALQGPTDVASYLVEGTNTIKFTVKNLGVADSSYTSNPAGLLYNLSIKSKSCSSLSVPQEPQTSTVTMCKTDSQENPLSGWTLILRGENVQSGLSVPTNTPTGVDSSALNSNISYLVEAVGTWLNQGGNNPADAEYSTTNGWTTHMDGYDGYSTDILELQINSGFDPISNWGTYNSAHKYAQSFIPSSSGPANFRIFDGNGTTQNESWFGDNSGNLTVNINKGYAGITGENGCTTFNDVPYGTYNIDEILQDEWENVSGLDEVAIDQSQENFNIVNRDTTITDTDTDDDGVNDEDDNCPINANADQVDSDEDQIGNVCDETPNGNGGGNNTVDVCLNIDGNQEVVPEGMEANENKECTAIAAVASSSSSRNTSGYLPNFNQGRVLGASTSCLPYLNSFIAYGNKNNNKDEVKKLQEFLNEYLGLKLDVDGVYGKSTFEASKVFQVKYSDDVLVPWINIGSLKKDSKGTGYVYKTTQRKINLLKCPELNIPMPILN